MVSAAPATLDLTVGAGVVLDGAEWLVELAEPHYGQVVLVGPATGERMRVSFRFLLNHTRCRPSTGTAALPAAGRGRQPATVGDLSSAGSWMPLPEVFTRSRRVD